MSDETTYPDDTDLTQLPAGEARALIRRTAAEVREEDAALRRQEAAVISESDREIALDVLTRETGDRGQALERLALASNLEDLTPKIATEKAARLARATAEQQAAYEASPAGRRDAAIAAGEAAKQKKIDAGLARELLTQDGTAHFSDFDSLSDDELISLAGMVEPEPEPEPFIQPRSEQEQAVADLDNKWWSLGKDERQTECERLGLSFEEASEAKLAGIPTDPHFQS